MDYLAFLYLRNKYRSQKIHITDHITSKELGYEVTRCGLVVPPVASDVARYQDPAIDTLCRRCVLANV